eukprot:c10579_g1_i1.p1 GENE.c10579_g1_i1~~c10579_g1_i1.p1  ORF type:complete len:704 (+),score=110.67 c10579_g1_i1:32-2143(+)
MKRDSSLNHSLGSIRGPRLLNDEVKSRAFKTGWVMVVPGDAPDKCLNAFLYLTETDLYVAESNEKDDLFENFDLIQSRLTFFGMSTESFVLSKAGTSTSMTFRTQVKEETRAWAEAIVMAGEVVENNLVKPKIHIAMILLQMLNGASMLKYGRKGEPHFRNFKLSEDGRKLDWNSKKNDSCVELSNVAKLEYGQKTANFKRKPMQEHESRSFSVISHGDRPTLDIICKDKTEFTNWTFGIQFLLNCYVLYPAFQLVMSHVEDKRRGSLAANLEGAEAGMEADNDLVVWGRGEKGQLGLGSFKNSICPANPLMGKDILNVALGQDHSAAILRDTGDLFSWGCGGNGRLGHNDFHTRNEPKHVNCSVHFTLVAAGDYHTLALSNEGVVYGWGMGHFGQHGHGTHEDVKSPKPIEALSNVTFISIATSATASFALTRNGSVYYWGLLDTYHVEQHQMTPQILPFDNVRIIELSCGDRHAAAITDKGGLWTWGDGGMGQLGHGTAESKDVPTEVDSRHFGQDNVEDVACGAAHTAVVAAGRVYLFGLLLHKEGTVEQFIPKSQVIPGGSENPIISLSCSGMMTAVATESGQAFVWGVIGSSIAENCEESDTPVELTQFAGKMVRGIICGGNHMAAFVRREWAEDERVKNCTGCGAEFTLVLRRHHCRKCGGIYCAQCSSKRFPLMEYGHRKNVRVCNSCYTSLSSKR